jgi:hypothetical protein
VKPVTVSSDGKLLAVGGSQDETIWELATGKKWGIAAKTPALGTPVFSLDGTRLFTNGLPRGNPSSNMNLDFACYDVTTLPPRQFDLGEEPLVVQPINGHEPVLLVSPVAGWYLSLGAADLDGHRSVFLRSLTDRRELGRFTVTGLIDNGLSPDGRSLALWAGRQTESTSDHPGGYVQEFQLLDSRTGTVVRAIPTPGSLWNARWRFSPEGRALAVWYKKGRSTDPNIFERPMTVDLWDVPGR